VVLPPPAIRESPHDVSASYPREYERRCQLADGRTVFVRPIVPADAPALGAAIRTADQDTLRRRFLGGSPKVTPTLLTHLTSVDYLSRFALVAGDVTSGRGVAIARYEPVADGVAELAIAVDPAWRRVGLATELVQTLAAIAIERGIHEFDVIYLAENRPVAELVGHAGSVKRLIQRGVAECSIDLSGADRPPPA
jgi:ribosomal protein S18 acetylase RimI-like enzyme